MSAVKRPILKKRISWTPTLIKMLRGDRALSTFGALIGVTKNTLHQWESGSAKPDVAHTQSLSKLAKKEHFLEDWKLVGSMTLTGDVEAGSKKIAQNFKKSLSRLSRQAAD